MGGVYRHHMGGDGPGGGRDILEGIARLIGGGGGQLLVDEGVPSTQDTGGASLLPGEDALFHQLFRQGAAAVF